MPHRVSAFLMFSGSADAALALYTSAIDGARVVSLERYGADEGGEEGKVKRAVFELGGQAFMCIDSPAVHEFTFTPSTSLFVECADAAEVDRLCEALGEGGQVFMPLDAYPFSPRFAWIADRFGVSWQLFLAPS